MGTIHYPSYRSFQCAISSKTRHGDMLLLYLRMKRGGFDLFASPWSDFALPVNFQISRNYHF